MSQTEKKADINKKSRETFLMKEDVISNSNSVERGVSFF